MRKQNHKNMRIRMQNFSYNVFTASCVSNVLHGILVDNCNISEMDKAGLANMLAQNLAQLRLEIGELRAGLFGRMQ